MQQGRDASALLAPHAVTLVYLAGAWLLGVIAGAVTGELWWPGVAAICAAGVAAAVLERRPTFVLLGLAAAGLFLGGATRYVDQQPPVEPGGIAVFNDGGDVRMRALVTDEPEIRGRSQRVHLTVRERYDDGAWRPESGGVLLQTSLFPRYEYGDLLELEGEPQTPPVYPDFDYADYLARQGISSLVAFPDEPSVIATGEGSPALAALHSVRRQLGDALAASLPEPQAALAQGIFLGQRSAIPADVKEDMNVTGITHLIAISGYNVSLVAALVISGLAWLIGRRQAAIVALAAIAAYTVLTGASPTVVRAAIMGGLFVSATLAGRPGSALTSVALAAAIMTGWQPLVIEDVSFQLSFAAILGLTYLGPGIQERLAAWLRAGGVEAGEGGPAGFLLESTSVTAAAVIATMPLFALYFGRISIVTFAANVLLVPAFPMILAGSALTAVCGAIWPPLGDVTGWFAWTMLSYMLEVARLFARVPLASVRIDGFGAWHAAAAYTAIAAGAWWLRRQRPRADEPQRAVRGVMLRPIWVACAGLAVTAAIAWSAVLSGPDGRLTVSVLDVGQGEAILIEAPAGRHILVDGGADGALLARALGEELPFWDRTLDVVALTHPQEDHLAGLVTALERFEVGRVLASPRTAESATYDAWREQIERRDIPYTEASPGHWIDLGNGATLRVLGPTAGSAGSAEMNNASLVLKLEWGKASFLLTGDIEVDAEQALLRDGADLETTVLKVAHHGSRTSTSTAFLYAAHPAIAVVSVGEDNPYGHPSPTVLERLDDAFVYRTDFHGTVRMSTDGDRLWLEPERGP